MNEQTYILSKWLAYSTHPHCSSLSVFVSSVFLLVPSLFTFTLTVIRLHQWTNKLTPTVPGCVCLFPLPNGIQGTFHRPVSRCSRSPEFKRLGRRGDAGKEAAKGQSLWYPATVPLAILVVAMNGVCGWAGSGRLVKWSVYVLCLRCSVFMGIASLFSCWFLNLPIVSCSF